MKICLINNLYQPYARGGAERVVELIADGLKQKGHEVFLITLKPFFKKAPQGSDSLAVYRICPLNIFSYININKKPAWLRFLWHGVDMFNPHSYWRVKSILKKEKPNVVMTHNLKGLGYLVPRAIKKCGIKHVHTLHDYQLITPAGFIIKGHENDWPEKSIWREWYEKINKKLFNSADIVISPSDYLLKYHEERGFFRASRRHVLQNPVEEKKVPKMADKMKSKSYFSFLYLGQIEWHKGILLLIEAYKKLLELWPKGHGPKLQIAGDGSLLERVKLFTRSYPEIIVRGRLEKEYLEDAFEKNDCLIVPSLWHENSPMVIYEALSHGLPVLASRIGGISELIEESKNGFLFEPLDKDDLLRALRYACENRVELRKMWRACRESVKECEAEKYVEKITNLCEFTANFLPRQSLRSETKGL